MTKYHDRNNLQKEFLDTFQRLCETKNSWTVWDDFVTASACSIANTVDKREDVWQKREELYSRIRKRYSKADIDAMAHLLAIVTMALDENPVQDFLGELYMALNLASHWHGQFFTPWSVSDFMSRAILPPNFEDEIKKTGYISVLDPACGGGSMLLAFANACRTEHNVNYQQNVIFVGQDVDRIVAMMCYIQMSLLGCPGYVVVGNSLTEPVTGHVLFPSVKDESNIWFTPFYFTNIWQIRRSIVFAENLLSLTDTDTNAPKTKPEPKPASRPSTPKVDTPKPTKPIKKPQRFNIKDFFKKGTKK